MGKACIYLISSTIIEDICDNIQIGEKNKAIKEKFCTFWREIRAIIDNKLQANPMYKSCLSQ